MKPDEFDISIKNMFSPQLAPFDFMGYLYRAPGDIFRVAVSLGLNKQVVEKVCELQCDLLLVHNAPENLEKLEYYKQIRDELTVHKLSLYRVHLPMDFSNKGLIASLCGILHFSTARPTKLQYEGYDITGGVYLMEGICTMEDLMHRVARLRPRTIRTAGVIREKFTKIAITTGDGCKSEFLDQIKPDVFVCGLLNQEAERVARDMGVMIIEATSYATENEPLKVVYRMMQKRLPKLTMKFIDMGDTVKYIPNYKIKERLYNKEACLT